MTTLQYSVQSESLNNFWNLSSKIKQQWAGMTCVGFHARCVAIKTVEHQFWGFSFLMRKQRVWEVLWDSLHFGQPRLKHQIAWHILSCAPMSDRCNLQDFAAAGQCQKSKPGSWFIAWAGSLRVHAAEAGPRVLLWWQPVFLPWNVFFEEKQDHWKRQAGPAPSPLPQTCRLCPRPACDTLEGLFCVAQGSLATDQGRSWFKGIFKMSYVKIAHNIVFFFFSHIVSIY